MKALLKGFFGVFAVFLGLGFFIQNPAVFWTLLVLLVVVFALVIFSGTRKTTLNDPERAKRRNTAFSGEGGISEGDIVHHHKPNGRPFEYEGRPGSLLGAAAYILKPDSKEAAPVVEPDPEIENAAAMYYEVNDYYSDEECEY